MILLESLIREAKVPAISLQDAMDRKLFGPVYHGTNEERRSKIGQKGFKVFVGMYGDPNIAQGYYASPYGNTGVPPPIHHLGFGIYFTRALAIAKRFAGGTMKGMKTYFLDVPKMEEINFGSERTMMRWWIQNGFDPELAKRGEGGRYMATVKLTETLKAKWDAVHYKGQGIVKLLDGNQVCVYEPKGKIFEIDLSLSKGFDIGAKVRAKVDIQWTDATGTPYGSIVPAGTIGVVKEKLPVDPYWMEKWKKDHPNYWAARSDKWHLTVKWKKGGEKQVADTDVEPLNV
jgi:hypothetical protein